jgi:hypothetical protein
MLSYLSDLTTLSIIIPIIFGVLQIKRFNDIIIKAFFTYLLVIAVFESISTYLSHHSLNNHIYYNVIDLISVILLFVLARIERDNVISAFILVLLAFSLFNLFTKSFFVFSSLNYIIIYTFQSIYMAYKLIRLIEGVEDSILKNSRFWLFIGMLLYGFSTVSVYILFEYVSKWNNDRISNYYIIYNCIINIGIYVLYSKSFLCQRKNSTFY